MLIAPVKKATFEAQSNNIFSPDFIASVSVFYMPIITLTSDYGLTDPYLPALKGAVLGQLPEVTLVDITHQIQPGNYFEVAFVLRNCYYEFPEKTVHLIAFEELVEPRRYLAAVLDGHFFVAPDNGILSMVNPEKKFEGIVEINLRHENTSFPAKDLMTRAACHLARGGSIDVLGRKISEIKESTYLRPRITENPSAIIGAVVYIDNFGNLITNISHKTFKEVGKERAFEVIIPRNKPIRKLARDYNGSGAGSILAHFNSQGLLEISAQKAMSKEFNGANTLLGLGVRDVIKVEFE